LAISHHGKHLKIYEVNIDKGKWVMLNVKWNPHKLDSFLSIAFG
jgi:hypothetical protein